MDSIVLTTTSVANNPSTIQSFPQSILHANKSRNLSFGSRKKPRNLTVFASKDEPKLDEWDQMELKFGRMIGEEPKITLAKILGRKSNPDMSYLEIEKLLDQNKGKISSEEIKEIPFDVPRDKKSITSVDGLNLVRPIPKKGVKFETSSKPLQKPNKISTGPVIKSTRENKSNVPNVILRKPNLLNDDGDGENYSRFGMKPNLTLRMWKEPQKERFSDITLLKKPELMPISQDEQEADIPLDYGEIRDKSLISDGTLLQKPELKKFDLNEQDESSIPDPFKNVISDGTLMEKPELITIDQDQQEENIHFDSGETRDKNTISDGTLLQKPELKKVDLNDQDKSSIPDPFKYIISDGTLLQKPELKKIDSNEQGESSIPVPFNASTAESQADVLIGGKTFDSDKPSSSTVLVEKPKRLAVSDKASDRKINEESIPVNLENSGNPLELEKFLSTFPVKDHEDEDGDWARVEDLVNTREREEVELVSASTRGFVVSSGSLVGFLPYRNLAARWKFLAFESWLRRKGLDPSIYRQNLGIIGNYETANSTDSSELRFDSEIDLKPDSSTSSDMKLGELLMIYDQEKLKFLSSFVGQKIRVGVVLADRKSRRLIFSIKPKEKEELVEKKRSLMKQLSVGDVVKCCIKKITYFGVFVEVEGVPALIHQSEVSWDATLDPESYFKVGQIVDAKVHQLDFSLERIFLSLKEITPDPLIGALEAVVGDQDLLDGRLEAAQADTEWDDVESLIKELQQFDGIQSVSKGRYFLSPGLAPTFQVYMASMFENQYKLLARAGNRVQEVIVVTSLDKEAIKSAILTCTNRVE